MVSLSKNGENTNFNLPIWNALTTSDQYKACVAHHSMDSNTKYDYNYA